MERFDTIGSLRERVTIQDQTQTIGDIGDPVTTWAPISNGTMWARMEPASERTLMIASRDEARFEWLCTIRFRQDITPQMRLMWRGRMFDVQGIRNADERRQYLTLRLTERRAAENGTP